MNKKFFVIPALLAVKPTRDSLLSLLVVLLWASTALAQVTPKGIYWLSYPNNDFELDSALAFSYVDGASMRYSWNVLEPGWGVYNFTSIDKDLAIIKARHKNAQILLMVGQQTPCWVKNLGAKVYADYAAFDTTCRSSPSATFQHADAHRKGVVALPWDGTYDQQLKTFIYSLASHLAQRGELSVVTGVVASGIAASTTETRLPNPTDTVGWTAAGYSRAKLKLAFRTIFTDWAAAFPNAAVSVRFLYNSFPQGFGACHTPDDLFPRELTDIAYSISAPQTIVGYNGLSNTSTINGGSGPGNLLPQMCPIQRGPSNLWQDCAQAKENCENGTDANVFQGSSLIPEIAYEGLQELGQETNTFATEWSFAEHAFTQLKFIEVYPEALTVANASALMAAHTSLAP